MIVRATHDTGSPFAARRVALECEHRTKAFWLDLDEQVHAGLARGDKARAIDRVSQFLFNRLEVRIVAGRAGRVPRLACDATSPRTRRALAWVSALLRATHARHLVLPDGIDLFGWALEQFASGAATTYHADPDVEERLALHGVPDSTEFLKLPELAFACLDHDIDTAFWREHSEALVLAARLFLAGREPLAPGTAKLIGCKALDHRPGRRLTAAERRAQRELHARGGPPEAAFTALLAATFVDVTLLGATVVDGTVLDGTVLGATVLGATVLGATVVDATASDSTRASDAVTTTP